MRSGAWTVSMLILMLSFVSTPGYTNGSDATQPPAMDPHDTGPGWPAGIFQQLPRAGELRLRLTSTEGQGRRQIARAVLRFRDDAGGSVIDITIATNGDETREFRARCGGTGTAWSLIDLKDGSAVPATTLAPGTLLPWQVLLLGWCNNVREVSRTPAVEGSPQQIRLEIGRPHAARLTLQVTIDPKTKNPARMVALDASDTEMWSLEVVATRRMRWGPVATRSIFSCHDSERRVLIEVRGGHAESTEPRATDDHPGKSDLP